MATKAQPSDRRFRDRAELLDFLLEVQAAASSTLDLDALLTELAGMIRQVVPCDLLAILLYSERARGLRIRYALGYSPETIKDLIIPLDEGITGVAASSKMPVVEGDVRSNQHYLGVIDAVRSEMAIPMTLRGKLVGVIDIQSTVPNAFTSEDSALVQLIASRASASIVNARLFRRVERHNRTLRALSRVSREFSSTLDLDELLGKVAATVRSIISFDSMGILLYDQPSQLLRHRFSLRFDKKVEVANIPIWQGITGQAARERRTIRVEDTHRDPSYIEINPGIRSELAIPLIAPEGLVGVLNLESQRVGFFTEEHVQTLSLLVPLVATAVENARLYEEVDRRKQRMEADLAAAQQLQAFLLPKEDPEILGLEVGIGFRPAHEISGDVFDFFEQGDDYALISIGDVSGKSAAAALYGAMVTGLLRTLAPRRRTPAALVETLNDALMERRVEGKYLTLLVALWQPKTKILLMANAAAIPPMIARKGTIIEPHIEGFPLGLFPGRKYDEYSFQTEPGDVIVFYSDGIQDQHNSDRDDYGTSRLRHCLTSVASRPAKEIVDAIFADFDLFRGTNTIWDDQTLVVLRVK